MVEVEIKPEQVEACGKCAGLYLNNKCQVAVLYNLYQTQKAIELVKWSLPRNCPKGFEISGSTLWHYNTH